MFHYPKCIVSGTVVNCNDFKIWIVLGNYRLQTSLNMFLFISSWNNYAYKWSVIAICVIAWSIMTLCSVTLVTSDNVTNSRRSNMSSNSNDKEVDP